MNSAFIKVFTGCHILLICSLHFATAQTVITLGAGQTIQTAYSTTIPSTISGAYVIELSAAYTTASESYPVTLTAKTGASAVNTITIRPAAGVASIVSTASSSSSPLFVINGASYITFDGRAGGTGSANNWTIQNTISSQGAGCIRMENGANYNTLQYLNLAGGSQPTTGVVTLLCNSGGPGNTNDLIQYCTIGAYSSTAIPLNCILAYGNGSFANSNITIQHNRIHDFWSTYFSGSYTGCGINVSGTGASGNYGDNWLIHHNSFYRTTLQNNGYYKEAAINFAPSPNAATATSDGNTISDNLIGGNVSALAHGDSILGMYTTWEATGGSPGVTFAGIEVHALSADITGNTISNILLFQYNTFDGFAGIYIPSGTSGGTINIQNNTIGSTYGAGKLYFGTSSTSNTISSSGTKTFTVQAGLSYKGGEPVIMVDGSGNGLGCGCYAYMMGTVASYSGTTLTINATSQFNTHTGTSWYIGIYKGIWNVNNGPIVGIYTGSSGMNATCNITSNTIGNLTSAIGYYNEVAGIAARNGSYTITGNTIYNCTTMMTNTSSGSSGNVLAINSAVAGISQQDGVGNLSYITNNTVYNLYTPLTGSAANSINGIELNGVANGPGAMADGNMVRDLAAPNTNTGIRLNGIYIASGAHQVSNSLIRLGLRADTTSIKGSAAISGIIDAGPGSAYNASSIYNNTVYIGGSNISAGSVNTYCFSRNNTISQDYFYIENNIFINNRSNATGTGKHFGIGLEAATHLLSVNYNDIYGTGAAFNIGQAGGTSYQSLSAWQTGTNLDLNSISFDPVFTDPLALQPDFHCIVDGPCDHVAGAAEHTFNDFYGTTRANHTPVDLGAIVISVLTGIAPSYDHYVSFTLYPNPVADKLTIDNLQSANLSNEIEIYNAIGERLLSGQSTIQNPQSAIRLDVSMLAPGIYFVRITTSKGPGTLRFVKL